MGFQRPIKSSIFDRTSKLLSIIRSSIQNRTSPLPIKVPGREPKLRLIQPPDHLQIQLPPEPTLQAKGPLNQTPHPLPKRQPLLTTALRQ